MIKVISNKTKLSDKECFDLLRKFEANRFWERVAPNSIMDDGSFSSHELHKGSKYKISRFRFFLVVDFYRIACADRYKATLLKMGGGGL